MPTTTWTLTAGTDNFTGTANDDIFNTTAVSLTAGDTLDGGTGINRLNLQNGGTFDLTAITITNVATVAADLPSTIKVAMAQLGSGSKVSTITGVGTGNTLTTADTGFDIHALTVSGIQTLKASTANSTINLDTAQLKVGTVGGSVTTINATGTGNTLVSAGTAFDLHSVTLANIQTLSATTAATSLTLTQSQLAVGGGGGPVATINATGTGNAILTADTKFDLTGIAIANVQTLEATGASAAFTIDGTQLKAAGGSIATIKADNGTTNSLATTGGVLDLTGVTLTNIQSLSSSAVTTFTIDGAQLATGGGSVTSITGGGAGSTIATASTKLDLTGVTVDATITTIQTSNTTGTTIKDTSGAHTILGSTGADTITGGGGKDTLTGGGGADKFVDIAANLGTSTITDLGTDDTITLTDVPLTGVYVNYSGGTLTVKSNGTVKAAIALTGTFSNNFSVKANGTGVDLQYLGPTDPTKATSGTAAYTITDGKKMPLVGTFGNDTFVGTQGGTSVDTVLENTTLLIQNSITKNTDGTITVVGPNGTDTLVYIDRIRFDDGALLLNPDAKAASVAGIYRVAYNRSPDEAGLNFQVKALNTSGITLTQMANNFLNSKEAAALALPSLTDTQFVTMLYNNAFNRAPDPGGLKVQLDALAHGVARASLLLNFATSAEELALIGAPFKGGVFCGYPDLTVG